MMVDELFYWVVYWIKDCWEIWFWLGFVKVFGVWIFVLFSE